MTEIERLEAERARIDAQLAELRAKKPDWGPAVRAYINAAEALFADPECVERGLIAALPLAPVAHSTNSGATMSEEEIEALAREKAAEAEIKHLHNYGPHMVYDAAEFAIRETLRRSPRCMGLCGGAILLRE